MKSCTKIAKLMIADGGTVGQWLEPASLIAKRLEAGDLKFLTKYLREGCESYGRKTCCYLLLRDTAARWAFEKWLARNDVRVSYDYHLSGRTTEFRVSYFKAFGHDK